MNAVSPAPTLRSRRQLWGRASSGHTPDLSLVGGAWSTAAYRDARSAVDLSPGAGVRWR